MVRLEPRARRVPRAPQPCAGRGCSSEATQAPLPSRRARRGSQSRSRIWRLGRARAALPSPARRRSSGTACCGRGRIGGRPARRWGIGPRGGRGSPLLQGPERTGSPSPFWVGESWGCAAACSGRPLLPGRVGPLCLRRGLLVARGSPCSGGRSPDLLSRLPQHLVAVVPPADDEEVGPGRYRRGLKVGEPVRPITESRDEGDLATACVRLCALERVTGGSAHHVQARMLLSASALALSWDSRACPFQIQ